MIVGAIACTGLCVGSAHAQQFGTNLLQNPGFEAGPSSVNGQTVVAPVGWSSIGSATVVNYGGGSEVPGTASPGPTNRGNQLLVGGPTSSLSQIFQGLDLSAFANAIDSGNVDFSLSAWLGGAGNQDDIARVIVVWADANAVSIRTDTLVGPSASMRQNVTGLIQSSTSATIPVGVRQALVQVTMARVIPPYNNASADNISLVLEGSSCDSIDFNNDGGLFDPTDIDAFLSVFSEGPCVPASAECGDIDFNNDGGLFDPCDIDSFLLVFSEGPCSVCGV